MLEGQENVKIDDAITTIQKIRKLCRNLSKALGQLSSVNEIFYNKVVQQQRQILKIESENLAKFPQFRREAMESFWKYCIYEPITCYNSFEELDTEDRAALKKFISKNVEDLSRYLAQFCDMQFILLIYLGDLYRYSYTLCGKDQRDFAVSEHCYKKAILAESNNGRPYNQLALLNKERSTDSEEEALFLFLRSLIQQKENGQALNNVKRLENSQLKREEFKALLSFALSVFQFSRIPFEDVRKEFEKILDEAKEDILFVVKLIQMSSMAAVYAFRNESTDEQFRYVASFLVQKLAFIVDEARRRINQGEEDMQANKRRKCKEERTNLDSTDSEDEEEEGSTSDTALEPSKLGAVWVMAITAAEFLFNCGEHFSSRKLSVSMKLQFQNLLKSFVDLLNDLPAYMSSMMHSETGIPEILDWLVGKCFSNELQDEKALAKVLAYYVQQIIAGRKVGIVFEKYFKMSNTNGEKEKQTIEKLSKLHFTHVNELNERSSRIPVYIAPDQNVLLCHLPKVESLLVTSCQTMIIARAILGRLDKVKKDNPSAREAIRWIQNSVAAGRVRMLEHSGKHFIGECLKFLDDKKLLDKQTLFLTILTTEKGGNDYKEQESELSKYPVISVEEIGSFVQRITATDMGSGLK